MNNKAKRIYLALIPACLLILCLLFPAGCDSPANEPKIVTKGLTMDEARQELNETGLVFASSIEQASELAGFQVLKPSFIPDGFNFLHISVENRGAGSSMPRNTPNTVSLYYTQREDFRLPEQSWFSLVQATFDLSGFGDELVEVCGKQIEQKFDSEIHRLTLSWQGDTAYYSLLGEFNDLLDEGDMKKIVCSILEQ